MGIFSRRRGKNSGAAIPVQGAAYAENGYGFLQGKCGVGLWGVLIHEKALVHPANRWNWSSEFYRLLGLPAEPSPSASPLTDRVHPRDRQDVAQALEVLIASSDPVARLDLECAVETAGGVFEIFRITAGRQESGDGKVLFLCGALIDTGRLLSQTEDQAKQNEIEKKGIIGLANGLAALANGDLTHRIKVEFAPKAAGLKSDFNEASRRLHDMMVAVRAVVFRIRQNTAEISSASNDLSRRTEGQAASLVETAAALEEITANVRKTAENAKKVASVTSHTQDAVEQSGSIVNDAVDAMSRIDVSSRQISQIIGVIDEIAFQTNLLALNAGVEAARAGEAGKGFAVVAQEVRELAQRSAVAAKEIKTLIAASSRHVSQGVSLVNETGSALQAIVGEIGRIAGLISEISSSVSEQSGGISEINSVIRQMDQMTQQNAAMAEETSAATLSLAADTQTLSVLLGGFSTEQEQTAGDTWLPAAS